MRLFFRATALTATLSVPLAAHAAGYLADTFGGAYGHAASDQATSIYYNPAALALGRGTRIYVDIGAYYLRSTYDRPVGAIDNPLPPGGTGRGTPADAIDANSGRASYLNF